MTTVTPTSTGGTITSWTVSPQLPPGLSLAASDGAISGTPTTVSPLATYTITGTNTGGSISTTITIEVNDVAPIISYSTSSYTLTKNTAMPSPATPTSTAGAVVSWSVAPTLPAGLTLNSTTGVIDGTPTTVTSSTVYTITATNTGGTDTATVTIKSMTSNRLSDTHTFAHSEQGCNYVTIQPVHGAGQVDGQFPQVFRQEYPLMPQLESSAERLRL